ncbi:MAG: dihydroorotate dehydrogenase electron transfer subunit [Oscillospiraceae bacterium]|nr:dihydroorotate dehydrogenase electron transfer subunit [Oscillospiraceae bacterium]
MQKTIFTLKTNREIAPDTYEMVFSGDTSSITAPGQFANIELPGRFLRRPISISHWTEGSMTLLVKAVGVGTEDLTHSDEGTAFDVLCGLGNGFSVDLIADNTPILAGGGLGAAPLYGVAKKMRERGMTPAVALGFRTKEDAVYLDEYAALGCKVYVATEDGTLGTRGFVTDIIRAHPEFDYVLCCGPLPMLKAIHSLEQLKDGQFSFEARMGCGFGACMGCTVPTKNGGKRVCKDGPILYKEEIVW